MENQEPIYTANSCIAVQLHFCHTDKNCVTSMLVKDQKLTDTNWHWLIADTSYENLKDVKTGFGMQRSKSRHFQKLPSAKTTGVVFWPSAHLPGVLFFLSICAHHNFCASNHLLMWNLFNCEKAVLLNGASSANTEYLLLLLQFVPSWTSPVVWWEGQRHSGPAQTNTTMTLQPVHTNPTLISDLLF